MRAVVLLADGFEECEGLIVVDILRRAGVETIMASISESLTVESSRGIRIQADALAEKIDFDRADIIILPGGRRGTDGLSKSQTVKEQCIKFAKDRYLAAICAAPSVLAGLGLLEGKKATCHPDYEKQMYGARLVKEKVVIEKNVITSRGLGTAFEFSLALVDILCGKDVTEKIKKAICY